MDPVWCDVSMLDIMAIWLFNSNRTMANDINTISTAEFINTIQVNEQNRIYSKASAFILFLQPDTS